MNDNITDEVVSTAECIEDMDSFEDLDPLEVKVISSLDHQVREIILVLTVGGPHIEVNVSNGTVSGSWGSESHTTHVNNESLLDHLHDRYAEMYRMQQ